MTDFVKVAALGAATILTSRGLVHFDHQSSDEAARFPEVPVSQVADLVERGLVEAPAEMPKAPKPAAAPAADRRAAALAKANAARAAKRAAAKAGSGDASDAPPAE